jgi:hypothetical protein
LLDREQRNRLILGKPLLDSIFSARNSRVSFSELKIALDAPRAEMESALEKRKKASLAHRPGRSRPPALRRPSPAALGAPATGSKKRASLMSQ